MNSPPTVINDYILGKQYGDFDNDITTSSDYGSGLLKSNCKLNGPNCWLAADNDKYGYIQVNLRNGFFINAISIQGRNDVLNGFQNLECFGHLMEKNILISVN